jgi:hypothetical protein
MYVATHHVRPTDVTEQADRARKTGHYCHGNGAIYVWVGAHDGLLRTGNVVTGTIVVHDADDTDRYLAHTPAHRVA